MCAFNQDTEEATVETDSPIHVLGKTDSYQVRLGAPFQSVSCLSVPCCHILQGISFYILEFFRIKIHVSVQWSSNWFTIWSVNIRLLLRLIFEEWNLWYITF